MSRLLRQYSLRTILGFVPLVVGLLSAVLVIVLILRWEANITDVSMQEIVLADEQSALRAKRLLEAGQDVDGIAVLFGEEVDESVAPLLGFWGYDPPPVALSQVFVVSFELERSMDQSRVRRLPAEAFEDIFSIVPSGTVVGPYESRDGWYVGRIEEQAVVGLSRISTLVKEQRLDELSGREKVVDFWLPVFLCSCGLLLTFSAGLWNIGIEGQVAMGAMGASSVALFIDLPREQLLFVELFAAAAAGGAWALLTAVMRTRGGVNEIFGGVAMNFIASNFSAYLLVGPWAPPNSSGSATERFPEKAWLPIMDAYNLSPTTIYIALFCFIFVLVTLSGSRWGLQLRAMGKNERSAEMLGIPTERNIWLAMTVCGAMAGLAGAHLVLFTRKNLPANVSGGIGFLALLVVLLASIRVLWVPLISFVFALLFTSRLPLQTRLQFDPSLIGVFVGLLVFFVFIFNGVRQRAVEIIEKRNVALAKEAIQEAEHGSGTD